MLVFCQKKLTFATAFFLFRDPKSQKKCEILNLVVTIKTARFSLSSFLLNSLKLRYTQKTCCLHVLTILFDIKTTQKKKKCRRGHRRGRRQSRKTRLRHRVDRPVSSTWSGASYFKRALCLRDCGEGLTRDTWLRGWLWARAPAWWCSNTRVKHSGCMGAWSQPRHL